MHLYPEKQQFDRGISILAVASKMSANDAGISKIDHEIGDDIYLKTRWNNQFKYMAQLPDHLQQKIDKNKTVFQKFEEFQSQNTRHSQESGALIRYEEGSQTNSGNALVTKVFNSSEDDVFHSIMHRHEQMVSQKPKWHAPWKLMRVINGHNGWVRTVAVDPIDNEWFATGSNDTTIKIWDLATGKLKLTLSGHIMTVKDICISKRHPYMFSASEDKLVKCWDLEKNRVIRDYHGHLSGVHTVDIHPTLNLIATAGRDSVVRLWDIRTKLPVMTMAGHKSPINRVKCLPVDPQVVSCSADATVRLWDITAGKTLKVLTHHKRSVRDIGIHPGEFSISSACTDDIRSWKLPEGQLLTNFQSEKTGIINTLSINQDDVLFAGSDNGALSFYDYKTGHKYQQLDTTEIPGSLESERGILTSTFDQTGLRLITGESDKSIKVWKQDQDATPETYTGLSWNPSLTSQRF